MSLERIFFDREAAFSAVAVLVIVCLKAIVGTAEILISRKTSVLEIIPHYRSIHARKVRHSGSLGRLSTCHREIINEVMQF